MEDLQGFLDETENGNGAVKQVKTSPESSVEDAKKADTPAVINTRRSEAVAADIDRHSSFLGNETVAGRRHPL